MNVFDRPPFSTCRLPTVAELLVVGRDWTCRHTRRTAAMMSSDFILGEHISHRFVRTPTSRTLSTPNVRCATPPGKQVFEQVIVRVIEDISCEGRPVPLSRRSSPFQNVKSAPRPMTSARPFPICRCLRSLYLLPFRLGSCATPSRRIRHPQVRSGGRHGRAHNLKIASATSPAGRTGVEIGQALGISPTRLR